MSNVSKKSKPIKHFRRSDGDEWISDERPSLQPARCIGYNDDGRITPPKSNGTKGKLSEETRILFFVAAHSPVLAEEFGVELTGDGQKLRYLPVARPWLMKHPNGSGEVGFDADEYAKTREQCSKYTAHMRLWILNVWNPGYARTKGWTFDLFKALNGLDDGNRRAIAWHLEHPVWP